MHLVCHTVDGMVTLTGIQSELDLTLNAKLPIHWFRYRIINLIVIPQLQYSKNKEHYFTIVEDYETYLESKQN